MPKKNQSNYRGNVKLQSSLGSRIIEALTEAEISQLLDGLFAVQFVESNGEFRIDVKLSVLAGGTAAS
ncbi:hypothetical protein [Nostoc sp.]